MKKILLAISIALLAGIYQPASAQKVSVSFNINTQPAWGPSGYDYAGYYYFPDLNVYFDVDNAVFYYLSGGRWSHSKYLPEKYRRYDLYSLYKVVLNDRNPWNNNKVHKRQYSSYRRDRTQVPIRDMRDSKYDRPRDNHRVWVEPHKTTNHNVQSHQPSHRNDNRKH